MSYAYPHPFVMDSAGSKWAVTYLLPAEYDHIMGKIHGPWPEIHGFYDTEAEALEYVRWAESRIGAKKGSYHVHRAIHWVKP